jgi:large subunit ribosomal protein L4
MSPETAIEIAVVDDANAEKGKVTLPAVFSARISEGALYDQVLAQLASRRGGTAKVKSRSEVRGGGKKPWRQKGTGRARAGSIRSPIWRGGGAVHGPQPRSYAYRLPRSGRRAALCSALAQKARDGQVRVIERLGFQAPKTKQLRQLLGALGIERSVLIVTSGADANVRLSARNLPHVHALPVAGLNVYDILKHDLLLVEKDALAAIEERLS